MISSLLGRPSLFISDNNGHQKSLETLIYVHISTCFLCINNREMMQNHVINIIQTLLFVPLIPIKYIKRNDRSFSQKVRAKESFGTIGSKLVELSYIDSLISLIGVYAFLRPSDRIMLEAESSSKTFHLKCIFMRGNSTAGPAKSICCDGQADMKSLLLMF